MTPTPGREVGFEQPPNAVAPSHHRSHRPRPHTLEPSGPTGRPGNGVGVERCGQRAVNVPGRPDLAQKCAIRTPTEAQDGHLPPFPRGWSPRCSKPTERDSAFRIFGSDRQDGTGNGIGPEVAPGPCSRGAPWYPTPPESVEADNRQDGTTWMTS